MAGRPRKTDSERIEDAFYDADLAEQDRMLRLFETLHRLKRRQGSERFSAPAKASEQLVDGVEMKP